MWYHTSQFAHCRPQLTRTRQINETYPKLLVLRNSRQLFVNEKLLWSCPGRVANVTRTNLTKTRFITSTNSVLFNGSEHIDFLNTHNSNPSKLCGSSACWRERDIACHAPYTQVNLVTIVEFGSISAPTSHIPTTTILQWAERVTCG